MNMNTSLPAAAAANLPVRIFLRIRAKEFWHKGEKYGGKRLLDIISAAGNDVQGVIKSITLDVTDFSGETSLEADIAFAVLEYTPVAAER